MSAADVERLIDAVREYVDPALDALHQRIDGMQLARGEKGDRGEPGEPGLDGVGMAGAFIDRDGELTVSLSDGRMTSLGTVHGKDGQAGLGFEDLDVTYDGQRTFTLRFVRGDREKLFAFRLPVMLYQGAWNAGTAYERGDTVTHGGSMWHCNDATAEAPDDGVKSWTRAVRRGRDGRNGKDGDKGDKGEDGRNGRDLMMETIR